MKTLFLLGLCMATAAHAETLKVHVTTAKSPEGFVVSQRVEESAKDLRSVLADKSHAKIYTLVDRLCLTTCEKR